MVAATDGLRWFYTDPLAAAWMAKHFGMRFQCEQVGHNPELTEVEYVEFAQHFLWRGETVSCTSPYFIRPDSLALLDPRPGDCVTDGETVGRVHHHWAGKRQIAFWTGNEQETALDGTERILQREGVPFVWPERA